MLTEIKRAVAACPRKVLDLAADIQEPVSRNLGAAFHTGGGYEAFAQALSTLVAAGVLRPVKAAGDNGRRPPLYLRYRKVETSAQDHSPLIKELLTTYRSSLNLSYFLSHPEQYPPVREIVRAMDAYLLASEASPPEIWDTVNERSFQLSGDEKFLASSAGSKLLTRLGLSCSDLHCQPAPEPFFYWSSGQTSRDRFTYGLIIENKDTFHSWQQLLSRGKLAVDPPIQLLIYGEGKKILHSWPFIYECLQPGDKARLFYFGDLDPEGIAIAAKLITAGTDQEYDRVTFYPAEPLYRQLLATGCSRLLKRDQSRIKKKTLLPFFVPCAAGLSDQVFALWEQGRIIPQEALPASRWAALGEVRLWPTCFRP